MHAVIFDDIELWATAALTTALADRPEPFTQSVFVGVENPKNPVTGEPERRDRMVIVRRDGGGQIGPTLEAPRLAVNVWATSRRDAALLAGLSAALLAASVDGDPVTRLRPTSGPSFVDDPSHQPRMFMTLELIARGADLQ